MDTYRSIVLCLSFIFSHKQSLPPHSQGDGKIGLTCGNPAERKADEIEHGMGAYTAMPVDEIETTSLGRRARRRVGIGGVEKLPAETHTGRPEESRHTETATTRADEAARTPATDHALRLGALVGRRRWAGVRDDDGRPPARRSRHTLHQK
ncbi:hypothetical protein TRIUR3_03834 [Triticum urartu]|uniref:Uncharacterized protein n=1 Tax=Triticum urartu TaxID=4572 RepID=M7YSC0_TRIUA|nr:hypothetical protein TRIUR3_03834 [Triticum urartu]